MDERTGRGAPDSNIPPGRNKLKTEIDKKILWVNKLYYTLGKQCTELWFQMQTNKGDDLRYSKRMHLFDINWMYPSEFLEKLNNRTTLKNELVFDFDKDDFHGEPVLFKMHLMELKKWLRKEQLPHTYWFSGSKSIHCHAYDNRLLHLHPLDRWSEKQRILRLFRADPQLKSESTTITCEYSKNSKTDNYKIPVDIDDIGWILKKW